MKKIIEAFKPKIIKTSSFLKRNGHIKYFIFIVYVVVGTVFFYSMYQVNSKNIFNFKAVSINKSFSITSNKNTKLIDINTDPKHAKMYLTFYEKESDKEIHSKEDSYPIIYRAKVVQGKLLPTKTYSTLENCYIVEIDKIPFDFKSIKISTILDNFEENMDMNVEKAPFFYINNDENFKINYVINIQKKDENIMEYLTLRSQNKIIKQLEENIKQITSNNKKIKSKITEYELTKKLPNNKNDDITTDQIDNLIKDLYEKIDNNNSKIDVVKEQIEGIKDKISDRDSIKKEIKEFKFNYDYKRENKK